MEERLNVIIVALQNLGRESSLEEIYREVYRINPHIAQNKEWKSIVRKTIYMHSSDAELFWDRGRKTHTGNDIFESNGKLRNGRWKLRTPGVEAECWTWENPSDKKTQLVKIRKKL